MTISKNSNNKQHQNDSSSTTKNESGTQNRGFASMPHEKVEEIAHKGGEARKEQLGHEGMAEMGRKGGQHSHSSKNDDSSSNKKNK